MADGLRAPLRGTECGQDTASKPLSFIVTAGYLIRHLTYWKCSVIKSTNEKGAESAALLALVCRRLSPRGAQHPPKCRVCPDPLLTVSSWPRGQGFQESRATGFPGAPRWLRVILKCADLAARTRGGHRLPSSGATSLPAFLERLFLLLGGSLVALLPSADITPAPRCPRAPTSP